jgi:hypothetical protein
VDSKIQSCTLSQYELTLDLSPMLMGGSMSPSHEQYQSVSSAKARIYDEDTDSTLEEWDLRLRFSDYRLESDPNGAGLHLVATYAVLSNR